MSKLNVDVINGLTCDVVKDLLPSYVDGICSEDSKQIVEEHLAACPECRQLMDIMRETGIVEQKREEKQIDYMKKIKKYTGKKEVFGLVLTFLIAGISIRETLGNAGVLAYYGISDVFYYLALPVLLLSTYFLVSDHTDRNEKTKWKKCLGIFGVFLFGYCILLELMMMVWTSTGNYPFGIEESQIGPFLGNQFLFIAFAQLAVVIAAIVMNLKTSNSGSGIISLGMTGVFEAFYIISLLSVLQSVEHLQNRLIFSALLLPEGLLVGCLLHRLERKRMARLVG